MGDWRNIVKKTYKNTAHIDRQTGEKMRKTEAITGLVSQGATLLDRYVSGKKDQAELDAFGASQGLEYDKKTKSYSGFTKGDDGEYSAYRIKSADLKNMRELGKYSDDTFQDFITNKEGGIKSIYQDKERSKYLTDLSKEPVPSEREIRPNSVNTPIPSVDIKDMKTTFAGKINSMFSGRLSSGEKRAYDKINAMEEQGYNTSEGLVKGTPRRILPEEYGEGYINLSTGDTVRDGGSKPIVPIAQELAVNENIKESLIKDPGFTAFDESAWNESENILGKIDSERINKLESSSRYYRPSNKYKKGSIYK